LLKQKPQKEVLESKPSTASSDEEKLAAGISTIVLQAKRFSGAQRKKLVRGRKMKEGTWMVEPKRNFPSQDKGTAGSSVGVKSPHSESSTPSLEKQQPIKTQDYPGEDWNLQGSGWQLFIGAILMLTWTRRFTNFHL
jgi:hypothetical protein